MGVVFARENTCVHMVSRGRYQYPVLSLCTVLFWGGVSPWIWSPTDASFSVLHNIAVTGGCIPLPSLLHEYWRFQLRSSCFFRKCSNLQSHFSRLLLILLISVPVFRNTSSQTILSFSYQRQAEPVSPGEEHAVLLASMPTFLIKVVGSSMPTYFLLQCFSSAYMEYQSSLSFSVSLLSFYRFSHPQSVLPTLTMLYSVNSTKIHLSVPSLIIKWTLQWKFQFSQSNSKHVFFCFQKPIQARKFHVNRSLFFIYIENRKLHGYWFNSYTLDANETKTKSKLLFPDLQDEMHKFFT